MTSRVTSAIIGCACNFLVAFLASFTVAYFYGEGVASPGVHETEAGALLEMIIFSPYIAQVGFGTPTLLSSPLNLQSKYARLLTSFPSILKGLGVLVLDYAFPLAIVGISSN